MEQEKRVPRSSPKWLDRSKGTLTTGINRLPDWIVRIAIVAFVLTALELVHVLFYFPAARSDTAGFLWYVLSVFSVYLFVGIPIAFVFGIVEPQLKKLINLISSTMVATVVVGTSLCTGVVYIVAMIGKMSQSRSFPRLLDTLHEFVIFTGLLVALVVIIVVVRPMVKMVSRHTPNLNHPKVAIGLFAAAFTLIGFYVGSFQLFALHLDYLSKFVGVGVIGLSGLTAYCIHSETYSKINQRVFLGLVLVTLCLLPIGPWQNAHSRFVLHGHTPIAGSMVDFLSRLLDFDKDGTHSVWLGGTDCDEFNPKRSPTRRDAPNDGIDQDCSGADSHGFEQPIESAKAIQWGCEGIPEKPSILLITIDALRYDVVNPNVMPNLDNFSKSTTIFHNAYSPAAYTNHSTTSLFTGIPITNVTNANPLRNNRICTGEVFPEKLKDAGYLTVAFHYVSLAAAVADGFMAMNPHPRPLDARGQNIFGEHEPLFSSALTNSVMDYFDREPADPQFLWLHYADTHAPYRGPQAKRDIDVPLTEYERTAAYVDFHLGRLLNYLAEKGRSRNTVVVITADHGEDLGQRGREGHGPHAFESSVHVPLMVWTPGCPPREIDNPVNINQLGSTFLSFAGVKISSFPLFLESEPTIPVVSEALVRSGAKNRLTRAFIYDSYKLLVDVKNGGKMLFDLKADPAELKNLYRALPKEAKRMEAHYQNWLDRREIGWQEDCRPGFDSDNTGKMVFGN